RGHRRRARRAAPRFRGARELHLLALHPPAGRLGVRRDDLGLGRAGRRALPAILARSRGHGLPQSGRPGVRRAPPALDPAHAGRRRRTRGRGVGAVAPQDAPVTIPAERRPLRAPWRARLHQVIFEADTPAGRAFDIVLLVAIVASVLAVMLESVAAIRHQWGRALDVVEWSITIAFTVEYVLRLVAVDRPWRYARSFLGIVDFLAVVPTYLGILVPEAQSLIVIRTIRLLRVFRIFKLAPFIGEAEQLRRAMRASSRKITVFLGVIITIMVMMARSCTWSRGRRTASPASPSACIGPS